MRYEAQSVVDDVVSNIVIAPISNTHIELSTKIAERALGRRGIDLTYEFVEPRKFSGGEFCPRISFEKTDSYQGKHVYMPLIPGPYKSSEELMKRAYIEASGFKDEGAARVTLVPLDFPHGRQERGGTEDAKMRGTPNTVRLHARLLEASGVDRVITMHRHSARIDALFALEYGLVPQEMLPEHLHGVRGRDFILPRDFDSKDERFQSLGNKVFRSISPHCFQADYLLHHSSLVDSKYLENGGEGVVTRVLDDGAEIYNMKLQKALFLPKSSSVKGKKVRDAPNDPTKLRVMIEAISQGLETLEGKIELVFDDGCETAGSAIETAQGSDQGNVHQYKEGTKTITHELGVPEDRIFSFTHAWLGGDGHQMIQKKMVQSLRAREFLTTNTRPYINDSQTHKFKEKSTVLRFAGLWADAILADMMGHDVSSRYEDFESEEQQHTVVGSLYQLKRHSRHFMLDGGHQRHGADVDRVVRFMLRE